MARDVVGAGEKTELVGTYVLDCTGQHLGAHLSKKVKEDDSTFGRGFEDERQQYLSLLFFIDDQKTTASTATHPPSERYSCYQASHTRQPSSLIQLDLIHSQST